MDHKLFLRVFSSRMKMPAQLWREERCNQFPNAKIKMSKTFHIDSPGSPRGSLIEAHYIVYIMWHLICCIFF